MREKPYPFEACKECCNEPSGGSITVDDYLDTIDLVSENPVQNKVIAARVSAIENSITVNAGSINHMISGVRQEDDTVFFDTPQEPTAFSVIVATPSYVGDAIGEIETSLENIITKYGLGGEAE